MNRWTRSFVALALTLTPALAQADLIVNPAAPITEQVTVQLIQTTANGGSPAATVLGDSLQRAMIESMVNQIWAQAGISINFLPTVNVYQDTFAYQGSSAPSPRPNGDLDTIVNGGHAAGVDNPNPLVLNMYLVDIVPGFAFTNENTANGLAYVGGNGIAAFVGDNLLSFTAGQEAIASVLAHEIGHNLGLSHIVEDQNLMQAALNGERLNALQISTALASSFSVPVAVPEPGSVALLLLGAAGAMVWKRRRRAA